MPTAWIVGAGMTYTYAALGGGRQGTAAAYDMAVHGDAGRVHIADRSAQARVLERGRKQGGPAQVRVELVDRYDDATAFTAIERTTGWDGALKAIMNAQGRTPRGVVPAEPAISGPEYPAELRKRGFGLSETWLER